VVKSLHIVSPRTVKLKANNLDKLLDAPVTYTRFPVPIDLDKRSEILEELDKVTAHVVLFGTSTAGKRSWHAPQ